MIRTVRLFLAATLAASPAWAQAPEPFTLELVCNGALMQPVHTRTDVELETEGGVEIEGDSTSRSLVPVPRRMLIAFSGASGRIKLPSDMDGRRGLDPDGWRPFQEVKVGEQKIEARIRFSALSKATVVIDRTTGEIQYNGSQFRGVCDKAETPVTARKF